LIYQMLVAAGNRILSKQRENCQFSIKHSDV